MRPIKKSPLKSPRNPGLSRIIIPQVGGEIEEGANLDNRSTTGSLGLNENPGTVMSSDQLHVTVPPETSTLLLEKRVPLKEESMRPILELCRRSDETIKTKPKKPTVAKTALLFWRKYNCILVKNPP